jgi:hypothetical protein
MEEGQEVQEGDADDERQIIVCDTLSGFALTIRNQMLQTDTNHDLEKHLYRMRSE